MCIVDVLIGLPGAGKTSYARNFVITNPDWMIITLDAVREMLYGRYVYNDTDQSMMQLIAGFIVKQVVQSGRNAIIDDTVMVLTKAARRELILSLRALLYTEKIQIRAIDFSYDFEICLNRRIAEPRGVSAIHWKKVISEMVQQFEPISEFEGFDEIISIDSTIKERI